MKKTLVILVVSLMFVLFGCAQNQTATQQMMSQTDDPILIGKALYFDAAGIYEDTAKTYLRYKDILKSYPEKNEKAVSFLNEMKQVLDDWKVLSGMTQVLTINGGLDEFQELRRKTIFQFAEFLEGGK